MRGPARTGLATEVYALTRCSDPASWFRLTTITCTATSPDRMIRSTRRLDDQ